MNDLRDLRVCKTAFFVPGDYFSPSKTLNCGQIFRYEQLGEEDYLVFSGERVCRVTQKDDDANVRLVTDSPDYFRRYFDLSTDYAAIESALLKFPECAAAVRYGRGIRILRQDLAETIISFLLSANNNIPRIRGILSRLCALAGKKKTAFVLGGETPLTYYGFPELSALGQLSEAVLREIGCGFRAPYLVKTVDALEKSNLLADLPTLTSENAQAALLGLAGIGPKVADCILLFALNRTERYPVDTWIFKAVQTEELSTKEKVWAHYTNRYKNLAGYAQQFLFYYTRSGAAKADENSNNV